MMSKLIVEVCRVEEMRKHPNADRMTIVKLEGKDWTCCTAKVENENGELVDRYKAGDTCIYIPVDAVLPVELSDKYNVTNYLSNGRVRAAKLRSVTSYGFVVENEDDLPVGTDVAEQLGITKYEPPVNFKGGEIEQAHQAFQRYTDIENIKNYADVLQDGEEVVATEKIHGCLPSFQSVRMADGSMKRISKIEKGEYVLGMNDQGQIVPSKVTHCFNNGKADKWLKIKTTRNMAGKGMSYASVKCTPNHQFYVGDGSYKAAEYLEKGDVVFTCRTDMSLNPIQEQILLGKMLGDGYLRVPSGQHTAAIEFGHKEKDENYLRHTLYCLDDLADKKSGAISGYGTEMVRARTNFSYYIKEKFYSFISDGIKIIPDWVEQKLTPLAIAYWYMDDGSLGHHESQEDRAHFAVCNFSEEDCKILLDGLAKFDIYGQYYTSSNSGSKEHSRIRLNAEDAEKLFILVAPYIPDCMQYKLPERYRSHSAMNWYFNYNLDPKVKYKSQLVEQEILEIEDVTDKVTSYRYDIETETHNFFAGDVLVHNSNCVHFYSEGKFMAASHRYQRTENPDSAYWTTFGDETKALLQHLVESRGAACAAVYKEVYGTVQKGYSYDAPGQIKDVTFDISVDGKYLSYDELVSLCEQFGLRTAPVLYRGPFDREKLNDLVNGAKKGVKTTLGDGAHIMEGVVIKPVVERWNDQTGRTIFKWIADAYYLDKNSGDGH
jgi:hypothetical protein